ncbi:hypothetical protein [Dyella telluris]|uniref:Uncharacterized protein n=1 Tax=Dyella telluris TaxID=2763498 RepID=A0A7G8Q0E2_9GAMM|nr:hypothetical protein [Dyella telluris]QNK00250.1 hypothetical protein H8F01_14140 [Dyella telluris]
MANNEGDSNTVAPHVLSTPPPIRLGRKLASGSRGHLPYVNSKKTLAAPSQAQTRTLPAIGTTWCYSNGGDQPLQLTLKSVDSGVATYEMGNGGPTTVLMKERIDTYTPIRSNSTEQSRKLVFPLIKGKQWTDTVDETVTAPLGSTASWQYHYHAVVTSEVTGTEKRQVGAGTFDTIVIERYTTWTKSNPRSSDPILHDQRCASESCSVEGVSKEILWYAPSVGRGVLRAYTQTTAAFANYSQRDDILRTASDLVTELVGYGEHQSCAATSPGSLARTPEVPWFGFPLRPNNTWEFMMQRNVAPD